MPTEHDLSRIRTTYVDLLDRAEGEDLAPFIGHLEAACAVPTLPAAVQAHLDRPAWATLAIPPRSATRPRERRRPPFWPAGIAAAPPQAPLHRWRPLSQALNALTTLLLVVGIALAAALLLRDRPVAPSQGRAATAGNWVYPGSLEGRSGIISVGTDGAARLLIEGGFYGVTPSPDGQRLLAYGNRGPGAWAEPATAAALYTREGQLLRRYMLGGATPLVPYWAPDSRHVAFLAQMGERTGDAGDYHTWLLDEQGERELWFGQQTGVGTATGTGVWSAQGRLLVDVAQGDTDGDGQVKWNDERALWMVPSGGAAARQLYQGVFMVLGWSPDGETAYILETSRLLALDAHTGAQRTVARFADIAAKLQPVPITGDGAKAPDGPAGFSFAASAIAPSGDRFAVWLAPDALYGGGTTDAVASLTIIGADGQLLSQIRAEANTQPRFVSWSPDSARLAYSFATVGSELGGIRVIGTTGAPAGTAPLAIGTIAGAGADGTSLRWSADGAQLAFLDAGGITVTTGANLAERRHLPGLSDGWPNWRLSPTP